MSEQSPLEDDSVYGGELNQVDFYKLEFDVDQEFPNWQIDAHGKQFNLPTPRGEAKMLYPNTKIYLFDPPYDWFCHIYHKTDEMQQPWYIMRPEHDEEQGDRWDELIDEMVMAGFRLETSGFPSQTDLEMQYRRLRGEEDIADILSQIIEIDG